MTGLDRFAPATRTWFESAFTTPTPAQIGAWEGITAGRSGPSGAGEDHVLVVAPTGSGKTLAAFLSSIDALLHDGPREPGGTRVLYVSPLKALAVDVERNLRSPLVGITQAAARLGEEFTEVTVGVRSGDTTTQERRHLLRHPPDILITTPESLFLMLTSSARETLRSVDTVIVDEVHAVAGTKRGSHLALSLERLDDLLERPARRIGLSATVRPHDEVARFLGGSRPVRIVSPESPARLSLSVAVPVDDLTQLATTRTAAPDGESSGNEPAHTPPSIWPHVEEAILDAVLERRSTIVFVNSRGVAERLTARLNEAYAERQAPPEGAPATRPPAQVMGGSSQSSGAAPDLARAHHGSVSKDQRDLIEDDLKAGRLRCVVATSSLELGIDMGAVDLVIQVSSPPSVASGLQRVGRAGHHVGGLSEGLVYPTSRHDLLASTVTASRMRSGDIERLDVPANPLDVLAQQTVAATALEPLDVEAWFDAVRRSAPFAALPRSAFEATLDLISGRYPSDAFAELRPRVVWDRDAGTLTGRPGAQRLAVTSGGTIPDRGLFSVVLAAGDEARGGPRTVGELDEEMVYESRVNDVVALGATSWRIQEITHDRVIVTPAFGQPARLPFWRGENIGRPYELGAAVGAFVRESAPLSRAAWKQRANDLGLDPRAAENLRAYLADQQQATGVVPSDQALVVERFRDELGDWRVVLHSPFGRRVHAPWALAVAARIEQRHGIDGSVVATDDGIVARIPDTETEPPGADLFSFDPDDLERIATEEVGGSALFASRFRECAARALLLPRRNPGARAPLWQQRQRAAQLLDVAREHPTFPILLETARECLQDVYDLPSLTDLARRIAARAVSLHEVTTTQASPFAQTQLFGYVAAFLYEGDSPLAERRAAALSLDPTLLSELLGRTDLSELLDPEVVARTERDLQRLAPPPVSGDAGVDRRAKDAEGVADLLRLLGPLTAHEVVDRSTSDQSTVAAWLADLAASRRVVEVQIAGDTRWAVVEDASRLRDALGVVLPLGIPAAHLESVADPLTDLVSRFARTHGPFTAADVADRLGLGVAVTAQVLQRLTHDRRLTAGRFRPDREPAGHPQGTADEWVDPEVLRRLRSRSLAAARQQVEPVDTLAFAAFLPAWQGVDGAARGVDGVLGEIDQLAGASLPASAWESLVLPSRVRDYTPAMLDELLAAGEVVWTGAGSLPGQDGWVRLHPGDLVLPAAVGEAAEAPGSPHQAIIDALGGGGAFLFRQLSDTVAGALGETVLDADLAAALWDLVWAGRVSNDTLAPLRSLVGRGGAHRAATRAPRARRARSVGTARSSLRVTAAGPPAGSGRWFAVEPHLGAADDPTSVQIARAETLLARYGVVTRGSVMTENVPGGFAATYRVLRELEQNGACLRGYYVETLGAAQFAATSTIDRLRATSEAEPDPQHEPALVLAATDPANAYGAALPWPAQTSPESTHRPARKAGSLVVLHGGRLLLYLERGGRKILTFDTDPDRMAAAAEALAAIVRSRRLTRLNIESVDGAPVAESALHDALRAAGFDRTPKGLRIDA